jgi:hypothetical protein
MRLQHYNPTVDLCSNCLAWSRYGLTADGKALGYCRARPPVPYAFRHVVQDPQMPTRVGIQEAQTTVWPSTTADMSCMEHHRKVDA